MVDPRRNCRVRLDRHAQERLLLRGLAYTDVVHMVRAGTWIAEGGVRFMVAHGQWPVHAIRSIKRLPGRLVACHPRPDLLYQRRPSRAEDPEK
ncbi:MAG: hypothetical protein ACYDFT_03055, partial [Thermoplasmata archaeon]